MNRQFAKAPREVYHADSRSLYSDGSPPERKRTSLLVPLPLGQSTSSKHYLVPWDVVLLERFPDDFFGRAVAVHIGGIPSIEPTIIGSFKER